MNYQEEAFRTAESGDKKAANRYHEFLLSIRLFLRSALMTSDIADTAKRYIFYDAFPSDERIAAYRDIENFAKSLQDSDFRKLDNDPRAVMLWHAVLGLSSEVGELIQALLDYLIYGAEIDTVNAAEELGDIQWYRALAATALGEKLEDIDARNLAKLKLRYPEKFTEQNAVVRDLEAERRALEKTPESE